MDDAFKAVFAEYEARHEAESKTPLERETRDLRLLPVGADGARLLHAMVVGADAKNILELGTSYGYSTLWLADAARETGGKVHTLDVAPEKQAYAKAMLKKAGLESCVTFETGDALEIIPRLAGPFDLVFIDADKPGNVTYLEWALRLTRPGAVIVVDNVVRAGAVADPASRDDRVLGSRAVIDRVAGDASLSGTVIQTVGTKGYDGFLLVRRTA